jgi:hypothetical protein
LELMIIVLLLLLLLSIWVANFGDSWCHRWNSWERCGLESIYILVASATSKYPHREGYKYLWASV